MSDSPLLTELKAYSDKLALILGNRAGLATTVKTNLVAAINEIKNGLGTAASHAATDFATSAQGSNADAAHGWGNHASAGYALSSSLGTAASHAATDFDPAGSAAAAQAAAIAASASALSSATFDASKITSGTIDIARIPAAALERLSVVANQAARYALTTATVQNGDTVKQADDGSLWMVVDDANLGNSAGYQEYTAGAAASVPWSGVTSKPDNVTAFAALVGDADKLAYFTGLGTMALAAFTSFGRTLVSAADAAAARTSLGLGTAATTDATAYATATQGATADAAAQKSANLSDLASAATARTNLGLGTAATTAATDYATAAQGTKADNALPKAGGTMTGSINMGGYAPTNFISNVSSVSGNKTVDSTYTGNTYYTTDSTGATWTLPNNGVVGAVFEIFQGGAGQITFSAASGATVGFAAGTHTKTARQYAAVTVKCVANSGGTSAIWVVAGATA